MTKSTCLSAAFVCITLLVSIGAVQARSHVPLAAGLTTQLDEHAAHYHRASAVRASLWHTDGGDDHKEKHKTKDEDKDKGDDKDKDKDDRAPSPVPEPSTLLSFGVALLIGGGALLSRRVPRNPK
jgi:hypothetical protein